MMPVQSYSNEIVIKASHVTNRGVVYSFNYVIYIGALVNEGLACWFVFHLLLCVIGWWAGVWGESKYNFVHFYEIQYVNDKLSILCTDVHIQC